MKKILLVEDEFIIARMIENQLESMGFMSVHTAMNGEKALESFSKEKFDLLLVDIKLNGKMDGIETVEKIREESSVPVIYLSGNSDEHTLNRSERTRPSDYLVKPLKLEQLQESIERTLNI